MAYLGNINKKEQTKRFFIGLIWLIVGVLMFSYFLLFGSNFWQRLTLLIPFFMGGLGLYQYRFRTCVYLAHQNQCILNQGKETITDPEHLQQIKLQTRKIWILSARYAIIIWLLLGVVSWDRVICRWINR